jgi:hypothetical protein
MDINVVVAVGVVIVVVVTFLASTPARPRATARAVGRRERRVHRNPACATPMDVEMLLGHELPADVTHEVCRLAEERQIPPAMLWRWAEAHSPTLLALAVGAGYTRQELAVSRPADSEVDPQSLEMYAELNGCLLGSMVVRAIHPATPPGHQQRHHRPRSAPYTGGLQDRTA